MSMDRQIPTHTHNVQEKSGIVLDKNETGGCQKYQKRKDKTKATLSDEGSGDSNDDLEILKPVKK